MRRFMIDVDYHADAGAYVATSKNISGLTLETKTVTALVREIKNVVPGLLLHNLGVPAGERVDIEIFLPPKRPRNSHFPPVISRLGCTLAAAWR